MLGKHSLTFTASSPVSNQTSTCQMTIHIKDMEPPRVISCPHSFVDNLKRGQMLKKISWTEPVFKDNVAIQHVMASFLPGHYFPQGRHHVLYQAVDVDGNRARCGFTITVKRDKYGYKQYKTRPRGRTPLSQLVTTHKPNNHQKYSHDRADSVLHLPPPVLTPTPRQSKQPHSSIPPQCSDVPPIANGKMACIIKRHSKKCTPVCNEGHVFYQKFSARPPTYICSLHRVDWKITKFIPNCSPVEKTTKVGQCPQGWEARDNYCVACPPGMFRSIAPLCQLCSKGTYSDRFGSPKCSLCSIGHTTTSLGTKSSGECRRGKKIEQGKRKSRVGRKGLMHYNSWLNEQPYKSDSPEMQMG